MAPFFEAAHRHELVVQRCRGCGALRFPARDRCSSCLSRDAEWTPGAALVRHWGYEGRDYDRSHETDHEDALLEFPQSGKRFIGKPNFLTWRKRYPAKLDFRIRRISGEGDLWVTENLISYDGSGSVPTRQQSIVSHSPTTEPSQGVAPRECRQPQLVQGRRCQRHVPTPGQRRAQRRRWLRPFRALQLEQITPG